MLLLAVAAAPRCGVLDRSAWTVESSSSTLAMETTRRGGSGGAQKMWRGTRSRGASLVQRIGDLDVTEDPKVGEASRC
jgi:hypothetical protein